ncbi:MAG: TonB-dependent receptor [Rhizomicrobium sp.]
MPACCAGSGETQRVINMGIRSALLMAAVCCAVSMAPGVALAGDSDATTIDTVTATDADQGGGGIETVTVTARQYSESIQTAPVSVTALNSDLIASLFVHNLADLDHQVPNFTIEGVGAIHRNAAVLYSRGIGYQGVDMGQDPAVGVSVNGVFQPSNIGMLSNMLDVDNVQVLRGPQGTLFGKNTVGGVINITTKLPGDEYSLEVMGRFGNFGRMDFFAAADIPIDDTLAARVSIQSQSSGGPFKNAYAALTSDPSVPKHLGGDDIKTVRGTLVWKPTSNFEADLVGTYSKDRSPSVGGQNGSTPTNVLFVDSNTYWTSIGLGFLIPFLPSWAAHPGYDYRTAGLTYPLGPNPPYVVHRNFPSGDYQDTTAVSLNARYHADGFDVVSVTGFNRNGNFDYNDYDNTELNFFQSTFGLDNTQWSQEVRVESSESDSPLKWVVGGLYIAKSWHGTQLFYSEFPTLNQYIDFAKQNDDSWALFGQADYNITPDLQVTAGIRYTDETKDVTRVNSHYSLAVAPCDPKYLDPASPFYQQTPQTAPGAPGMACTFFFKKTWTNTNYHVGVNYQIDSDKMVYASWSTGFVAGGFNTRVDSAYLTGTAYNPESVQAWEIGLKSDWFDHHLRVNAAAFMNKYSNIQVGAFIPGGGFQAAIVNNAFERAQGLELEITALPLDHLTLNANIGLLDANYTSLFAAVFVPGVVQDYSYLRPARVPKWTMNFSGSYEIGLGSHGTLTPSVSVEVETSHFTDLQDNPVGFQPTYALLDASLVYNEPKGRWQVALWGKNLTNEVHRLSGFDSSGYFTQLYFANPATYGVDVNFKL